MSKKLKLLADVPVPETFDSKSGDTYFVEDEEKQSEKRSYRPRSWSIQKENFYKKKYWIYYDFFKFFYPQKKICGLPISRMENREVFFAFIFDKIQRTQRKRKHSTNVTQEIRKANAMDKMSYVLTFKPKFETYEDIMNKQESIFVINLLREEKYYLYSEYLSFMEMVEDIVVFHRTLPNPINNALNLKLNHGNLDKRNYYTRILEAWYFLNYMQPWTNFKKTAKESIKALIINLLFKKRKNENTFEFNNNPVCQHCPIRSNGNNES